MTVFAHPDDAELSCFGLLAKLRKMGWRIVLVVATRGENGADAALWDRQAEARTAAKVLNAEMIFGDFADGHVPRSKEVVDWIETVMGSHRPDIVVTHFAGESRTAHQDHIAIEAAVQIATRRAHWKPTLLLAEGIDNDVTFQPNWFADITEEFDAKLASIQSHVSQRDKYYMRPSHQKTRAKKWALNFPPAPDAEETESYWEAFYLAQHTI